MAEEDFVVFPDAIGGVGGLRALPSDGITAPDDMDGHDHLRYDVRAQFKHAPLPTDCNSFIVS